MRHPSKDVLAGVLRICRDSRYFAVDAGEEGVLRLAQRLELGERLMENVRKRWRNDVTGLDLNAAGLSEPGRSVLELDGATRMKRFEDIQKTVVEATARKPFDICERYVVRPADIGDLTGNRMTIGVEESHRLSTTRFTSLAMRNESFVSAQRQRKIWWMKIFANPGRLYASEFQTTSNVQHTSLCTKFPFGDIEIERFECMVPHLPESLGHVPVAIRSTICLESATFVTLLDAIDASVAEEICLDRTIAPFQCTVLGHSTSQDQQLLRDVTHLTKYVQLLASRSGISMLNDSQSCVASTEDQLADNINRMDALGVPYVMIVEESSLHEGMLRLRNRDTTLTETIHLSDVPAYLLQIFNINHTTPSPSQ